ncbi:class IV adenylate cyclase [archaeon]|jgi:predicted adenylyl cyclase CyaB|nr:class IV adenylate cyclase [archaeon]
MKEVEILVKILDSKEETLEKLNKFNFVGVEKTLDIYFQDPKRKDLQTDENGFSGRSFRLRKKGNKIYITYKVDQLGEDGNWLYSDEHETEVQDFDVTMKIINHLGLEILVELENEKHIFLTDEYEIVFEDVKDLGLFLEVEKLNVEDHDDLEQIKKDIRNFIETLEIKTKEELNIGKPGLMLQKKNNQ